MLEPRRCSRSFELLDQSPETFEPAADVLADDLLRTPQFRWPAPHIVALLIIPLIT